jgi:integrase
LGLQWKCFDEEKGTITIGQQIIQTLNGRLLSSELKTNESYRINQLSGEMVGLLKEYRSTLKGRKDDDFIFPSPYSAREPLSKTEFRRRFYKYIEKAGVPRIVPHGVRHSKATMLASVCHNAEEIAVGAKFLGHSPTMFMETYVSKNGISQSDLIKRLNKGENQK